MLNSPDTDFNVRTGHRIVENFIVRPDSTGESEYWLAPSTGCPKSYGLKVIAFNF